MPIRPDDEELYITVNNQKLGGWMDVKVTRSVERWPSAFYISMTDRSPGEITKINPKPGSECRIYLSNDLILTGFVDVFNVRLSAGEHVVQLAGRSRTQDVADSGIDGNLIGGWHFALNTIGEAARKIATPYKVDVSVLQDHEIPPPNVFSINPGMTGAALLEEIARTTGSLVWDDPQGRLVISDVGTSRTNTALVEGQNIEAASAARRTDIRFGDYNVYGQGYQKPGTAFENSFGHAEDPEMKATGRVRTRVILHETPDPKDRAGVSFSERRALWEAARRFGRGNQIVVQVTGWRDREDKLWTPNTVVSIDAPVLKVREDLVIAEVTWSRGPDTGTTSMLTCMPKAGLVPQPLINRVPITGQGEPAPSPS